MIPPSRATLLASLAAWSGVLLAPAATAQSLELVADLCNEPNDNYFLPELRCVELGGWLYFAGDTAAHGEELQRVPIPGGPIPSAPAELVADILPGSLGSRPDMLTVYGTRLVFVATDGVHGRELWTSDGTAAGTQMVVDLHPGLTSAFDHVPRLRDSFPTAGGLLYFGARTPTNVRLFSTNGTAAGTTQIALTPFESPKFVGTAGGLFLAATGSAGSGLWRVNGTTPTFVRSFSETRALRLGPNGRVFLTARSGNTTGLELWSSDGTNAGTVLVKDVWPGAPGSDPAGFTFAGGFLYFTAYTPATGRELWKSDGTDAGTVLVKDLWPGSLPGAQLPTGLENGLLLGTGTQHHGRLTHFNNRLWLSGTVNLVSTLWSSDGTDVGTVPLLSGPGAPTIHTLGSMPQGSVGAARLLFAAHTAAEGRELWSTDGTALGTALVLDLQPGAESSNPRGFSPSAFGGTYFVADAPTGPTLFHSDGTAPGTTVLAQPVASDAPHSFGSSPFGLHTHFDRVVFAANTDAELANPRVSTGQGVQTLGTAQIGAGPSFYPDQSNSPYETSALPRFLGTPSGFYYLTRRATSMALWKSNGTDAGSTVVREFDKLPSIPDPFNPKVQTGLRDYDLEGATLGERLVFRAYTTGVGYETWITDGTFAGTQLLHPASGRYTRLGAKVLIFASPSDLWITDGTAAGTQFVANVAPQTLWFEPAHALPNGRAIFLTNSPAQGVEPWVTDGTGPGTQLLKDIQPGPAWSWPRDMTRVGRHVYFSADDGTNGSELWKSDGTAAGTVLELNIQPAPGVGSGPEALATDGRVLFFRTQGIDPSVHRYEPPALSSSAPEPFQDEAALVAVGSRRVVFAGNALGAGQSGAGVELWSHTGQVGGAKLVADHTAGQEGSQPSEYALANGRVFVVADDKVRGQELFSIWPGATAQRFGMGCGATGYAPELHAEDPVLGGTSRIFLTNAPPLQFFGVLVGPIGSPLPLSSDCALYLDPLQVQLLATGAADGAGAWTSAPLPIPAMPVLVGAQIGLQAFAGPTSTLPLGFDFTNAVRLSLGN
ncbi:MAG: hypothetical protein GC161_13315 [Planctomycetaceae bacterium]|nr:hypothetical protein [Planctomycetaceae bacterium]